MIHRCQGFNDLLPQVMAEFRKVEASFLKTAGEYGYQEIRTPTIEYLYLFTSAGTLTPGKLRRTYSFLDWDGWSGERVVLKPEATIPVARMYIEHLSNTLPVRLCYVTNTFMFDETGKKTRERWQCGAESIGRGGTCEDEEIIGLVVQVLEELGIKDIRLRLSHSGLISTLLKQASMETDEYNSIFDELLDGNEKAIDKVKQANPELADVFSLMLGMKGESSGFLRNLKVLLENALGGGCPAIQDFIAVTEAVQAKGIEYEINLASAKGYEYYTGTIFHVLSGEEMVGSGGRYDNLIGLLGGPATPAAGFALYMDRLIHLRTRGDVLD